MSAQAERKLIIQIDRPGERLEMKELLSLLEPLGVHVDPSYGPISINPKLGRFVVRGTASPAAVARVQSLPGVSVFRDAAVDRVRG